MLAAIVKNAVSPQRKYLLFFKSYFIYTHLSAQTTNFNILWFSSDHKKNLFPALLKNLYTFILKNNLTEYKIELSK